MPKRFYRRRTYNRDKYSVEQTVIVTPSTTNWTLVPSGEGTQSSYQFAKVVVPESNTEGMRKVKHLQLSFSNAQTATEAYPLIYALVYVPSGYEPNHINHPDAGSAANVYEPNQYVMSCGVLDFSGGPLRITCPLSRNLNSGDSIALVLSCPAAASPSYSYTLACRYAITLQ